MSDLPAVDKIGLEVIAPDGTRRFVRLTESPFCIGRGALVAVHSSAKSGGAVLRLCNLGSRTNELLQMTRLVTVFEVSNSEADAVKSFSK